MSTAEQVEIVREMHQDFLAFKVENDNGRKADQDKLDKINGALNERLDQIEVAFKRTGTRVGTQEGVDETKNALAFEGICRGAPVDPDEATLDVDQYRAYAKAFGRYLRRGEAKLREVDKAALEVGEAKALSTAIQADGGYWVVPEMSDRIVTRQFETSPIRSLASVITIGTSALEMPTDTNDAVTGGWIGEKGSGPETATPEVGTLRIPVHEQYAFPMATQNLLDDANIDAEGWLADKIADKLVRDENVAFVTGNGVDRPKGFTDYSSTAVTADDASRAWGVLQYVATGKSADFDDGTVDATAAPSDELIDLESKLKPIYRAYATWLMRRAVEAKIRKMKTTTGEYVTTLNLGNITGQPLGSFSLLGHPIVNAEDLPALAANSFSVVLGDWRAGYQFVDRQGIRILRDPFTNKPFVGFYITKRVGGDVVDFDALKLLKFGVS